MYELDAALLGTASYVGGADSCTGELVFCLTGNGGGGRDRDPGAGD